MATAGKKTRVSFVHRQGQRPQYIPSEFRDRVQLLGRAAVDVVAVDEWWFEVGIDAHWMAAYRMLQQNGSPVIGEVRVFPCEDGPRQAGEWSGVYLGKVAAVPEGGITARLLKRLRPGDTRGSDVAQGREAWKRYMGLLPGAKQQFKNAGFRSLRKPRHAGGRRGWSDQELLDAAVFYVERGGRKPVVALAAAWKLKNRDQARDLFQSASRKGLLTAGIQGKTSRALTEKAKALLAQKGSGQ